MKRTMLSAALLLLFAALVFGTGTSETSADGDLAVENQFEGEIVVSIGEDDYTEEAIFALEAAYQAYQPNVDIVWEPAVGGDYAVWLGTQLAAGNVRPDIVMGNYQPTYDGYVNFDRYRNITNPYTGNPWDEDLDFEFFTWRNPRGERAMVATQAVHVLWFYNKTIFDELGLEPPESWDELVEVSAALDEAGHTPIASNYTYMIPQWLTEIYWDQYNREWHKIVRAQPGDYNYDPAVDGEFEYDPLDPKLGMNYNFNPVRWWRAIRDGVVRFDTPVFTEMITQFTRVFNQYVNEDVYVENDPYPRWLQGNAAMMVNGAWMFPTIAQDMANLGDQERREALNIDADANLQTFEWSTFEMPSMQGEFVDGPARSVESAVGEYISVVDKNQEQTNLVIDFVMFWLSKPGYQAYVDGAVETGNYAPSGPIMVSDIDLPGELQGLYDNVELLGNAEHAIGNFVGYPGPQFAQQSRDLFKLVLDQEITPAEYAARFQALLTDNLPAIIESLGLEVEDLENPQLDPNR